MGFGSDGGGVLRTSPPTPRVGPSGMEEEATWSTFLAQLSEASSFDELACPDDWSERYEYTYCSRYYLGLYEFVVTWEYGVLEDIALSFDPVGDWEEAGGVVTQELQLEGGRFVLQFGGYMTLGNAVVMGWDGLR